MPNQRVAGGSPAAARVLGEVAGIVGCSPLDREPLTGDQSVELARVFKAMGDPVRLRLLSLIASHAGGEACVCDLTGVFDLSGPTISHHLKVLRKAGLITGERRGTWIYYRVRPESLGRLSDVLVPAAPEDPSGVEQDRPATRGATRSARGVRVAPHAPTRSSSVG